MSKRYVVDTNTLIENPEIIKQYDIVILSHVYREIEKLKLRESTSYKARVVSRYINEYCDSKNFDFKDYKFTLNEEFDPLYEDNKILQALIENKDEYCLVTYDTLLKFKAKAYGVDVVELNKENQESYKGYKIIQLSDEELAYWYENEFKVNSYNLLCNEYLLIQNKDGEIVDKFKWTEKGFRQINKKPLQSMMFGTIKPKDIFQEIAIDSLINDQFTILTGHAGTAKSLLSLAYSFWAIQNHKYDRLIIAYNPCVSKGSSNLGYYSGNRDEKLMQSSLGSMLNSKLGDSNMVKTLMGQGTIVLVPTADIRGMEVKENEILYIPEAQNTSVDIMKLCIQRASEKSKIIAEGDTDTQVDSQYFVGDKNGLKRAISVFKGADVFGSVYLPNIYRSRIADIAERM